MAEYMTQEQIDNCKVIFNVYDKNGDGIIDIGELGSVFDALGLELTLLDLQDSIRDIDFDSNGVIDFPEFLSSVAHMIKLNDSDESVRETFDVIDKDQNGFITPEELREVLLKLGESVSDEEVLSMISEADYDGDGQVSFEDFKRLLLS
ncbi:hypothetical protein M569_04591, partial [Genlisea aurea]